MQKYKRKSVLGLLLSFCLLWMTGRLVYAGQSLQMNIEGWRAQGTDIYVYANDSMCTSQVRRSVQQFQFTLGNMELPVSEVCSFSDSGEGAAYVWLVDVSGSIHSDKLDQMKSYLMELSEYLGEKDKVSIVSLGNEVVASEFLSGKKAVKKQIEAIKGLADDTNLYYGIAESLRLLSSDSHGCEKKILVVLSDGHDEQITGITREELDQAIKESHIPVYTATMLDEYSDAEQQEFAKILGSFARESAGGIHMIPQVEGLSLEDCARIVMESVQNSYMIKADLSNYTVGNGKAYLQIRLSVEGEGTAEGGYEISERDFAEAVKNVQKQEPVEETEIMEESAAETVQEQESAEEPQKKIPIWVYIAIGSAVAVVILVIVVVSVKKKAHQQAVLEEEKRRKAQEEAEQQAQEEMERKAREEAEKQAQEEMERKAREEAEKQAQEEMERKARQEAEEKAQAKKISEEREPDLILNMTVIGLNEKTNYQLPVYGELTIGRNPQKAAMPFPKDMHMSGLHCMIRYENGKLILSDCGSRNGTAVNGVVITDPYILERHDVIYIGRTEMRLDW